MKNRSGHCDEWTYSVLAVSQSLMSFPFPWRVLIFMVNHRKHRRTASRIIRRKIFDVHLYMQFIRLFSVYSLFTEQFIIFFFRSQIFITIPICIQLLRKFCSFLLGVCVSLNMHFILHWRHVKFRICKNSCIARMNVNGTRDSVWRTTPTSFTWLHINSNFSNELVKKQTVSCA